MSPTCIICTEPLGHKDVSATRCGHVYHESCIERWLDHAGSCPQCRKPLSRTSLIHKLYFTTDDTDEAIGSRQAIIAENTRKLRESLQQEKNIAEELRRKLEDELTNHRLTKTCCIVFKEAFHTRARKEIQVLTNLQNEIANFWLVISQRPLDPSMAEDIWKKLITISATLNSMKQRQLHSSDTFIHRLWSLVAEIRNRTNQVKDLERRLAKLQLDASTNQRKLRADKQRMQHELVSYQSQINDLRTDLQAHERQTSEIAAENATLACLLEWHRQQQARRNFPMSATAATNNVHRLLWVSSYPLRLLRRGLQCILNPMDDVMPISNISYTAEIALYRRIVERNNLQKTAIFTAISVLSYYMASWLGMSPAIVLLSTGIATGFIIPGAEYWRQQ